LNFKETHVSTDQTCMYKRHTSFVRTEQYCWHVEVELKCFVIIFCHVEIELKCFVIIFYHVEIELKCFVITFW